MTGGFFVGGMMSFVEVCRCSVAAWEDSEDYDAWLDYLSKGGTTEEWNRLQKAEKSVAKSSILV